MTGKRQPQQPLKGWKKALATRAEQIADIRINGDRPWDIRVIKDSEFWHHVLRGNLGLGEAFMYGFFDIEDPATTIEKALNSNFQRTIPKSKIILRDPTVLFSASAARIPDLIHSVKNLLNKLKDEKAKAHEVVEVHYDDLGNDWFEAMLGEKTMAYTNARWEDTSNLDNAQLNKFKYIAEQLQLKPGMSILDIGGGFGGLAIYLAENYRVRVVNMGISQEQINWANKKVKEKEKKGNLPLVNGRPAVENRYQYYQDLDLRDEKFDRVISVEMVEQVKGMKNLKEYYQKASDCLMPGGLFYIQAITVPDAPRDGHGERSFITTHIFPNGCLTSLKNHLIASEEVFRVKHIEDGSDDYPRTLEEWVKNIAKNWNQLKTNPKYGDPNKPDEKGAFYRTQLWYLQTSIGGFRAGHVLNYRMTLQKR